ncbi:MAG: hypothetical protein HY687_03545 [Chloroflexi bacterium]|nr:hypothetical protein [Chloroflexota bacterium]
MKTKTLVILGIVALALVAALSLAGNARAQTPPTTNPQVSNHCGLTLEEMKAQHESIHGAGSFDQMWQGMGGQMGTGMMSGTGGMMGGWGTTNGTTGTTGTWQGMGSGMMGGSYGNMMGSWR